MNPEIEKLIDMVVADGQITEKEREVVLKKAEALGEDIDEVEIYLDAKLHQKNEVQKQEVFPVPPLEKPSFKEGDNKKCPSCGAPVQSFATKCSDCGHEFRNIQAASSVQKLFEMLNELEGSRKEDETNPLKALGESFSKQLSGQSMFNGGKTDRQKKELIKNFPIPNTKEDLIEFLTVAVPRAKKVGGFFSKLSSSGWEDIAHNEMVPIWKSKCEQIIMKARFSMKEDKSTLSEIEYYAKELKIK